MQRLESYGLLGTRRAGPTAAQIAGLADQMVRSALVEMTKQHGREPTAEPSPRRQTPAPVRATVGTGVETRPAVTVVLGGSARLGGRSDLAWALRELAKTPQEVLRREVRRDPQAWAAALSNLDRLTAQAAASRTRRARC